MIESSGFFFLNTGICHYKIPEHDLTFDLSFQREIYTGTSLSARYTVYMHIVKPLLFELTDRIILSPTQKQLIMCSEVLSTGTSFDSSSYAVGYTSPTTDTDESSLNLMRYFRDCDSFSKFSEPNTTGLSTMSLDGSSFGFSLFWTPYQHRSDILESARFSFSMHHPVWFHNGKLRKSGWDSDGEHGMNEFDTRPRLLIRDRFELSNNLGLDQFSQNSDMASSISLLIDDMILPSSHYEAIFSKHPTVFHSEITITILKEIPLSNDKPMFDLVIKNIETTSFRMSKALGLCQGKFFRSPILAARTRSDPQKNFLSLLSLFLSSSIYSPVLLPMTPDPPNITHVQLPYFTSHSSSSSLETETPKFRVLFSTSFGLVNSLLQIIVRLP